MAPSPGRPAFDRASDSMYLRNVQHWILVGGLVATMSGSVAAAPPERSWGAFRMLDDSNSVVGSGTLVKAVQSN